MEENQANPPGPVLINTELLVKISHEFRAPLNSIIGFSNLLLKNKEGNLSENELEYASRIVSSGNHLLTLVTSILDLARIESQKTPNDIRDCNLGTLLKAVVEMMEGHVLEKESSKLSSIIPKDAAHIQTDKQKLKIILINLVSNAVKFTKKGKVEVRLIVNRETRVPERVEVEDSGPGIPKEKVDSILKPFSQITALNRKSGHGLGLAIAKTLADELGYRIQIQSEVGKGSTFTLYFTP